jgi:hypothetical protein
MADPLPLYLDEKKFYDIGTKFPASNPRLSKTASLPPVEQPMSNTLAEV